MADGPAGDAVAAAPPPGTQATPVVPAALLRNLVVDAVLPWLAVQLLQHVWHVPTVPAFIAASAFPAASIVVNFLRRRRLDFIGAAVLVTLLGGIAVAALTQDVRFAVVKAAPGIGLFGIACLFSLGRARPLMFFVARQFSAGDDEAKAAAFTARLASAGFRRAMRLLTIVWGVGSLVESALGITVALRLPPSTALVLEPMLGVGTTVALLVWTVAFARRREAQARAQTVSG